jgi:methionine-rich copper-binding protein CopC
VTRSVLRLVCVSVAFLAATAGPVWAHAFPDHSEPRVGSEVKGSPPLVRIWFDSRIEPLFSTISVVDQQGRRIDTGKGGVDPSDPTLLVTNLPSVPPGLYTVIWDVIAVDGHRTEGKFNFTVRGSP